MRAFDAATCVGCALTGYAFGHVYIRYVGRAVQVIATAIDTLNGRGGR